MLTKSRDFDHPLGFKLKTPLLIPSFSSKGFNFQKRKIGNNFAEVSELFNVAMMCKELLTESLLVSAYDLFYGLIPSSADMHCTDLTFIDSGGYETSQLYDFSGINKTNNQIKEWKVKFLKEVIEKWPKEYPSVIINYDHGELRQNFDKQVAEAQSFFQQYGKDKMSDFLIKPETKEQTQVQIKNVVDKIYSLHSFDIIGLTEKEIGDSILNRMLNISKVRKAMDSANINKPIHVFGSLDPISSVLYYLAGAEIFDGLTWLKFAYYKGMATYVHNYAAFNREIGIHTKDTQLRVKTITNNIAFLDRMKYVMMDFHTTKDFGVFEDIGGKDYALTLEKGYNRFTNINKT